MQPKFVKADQTRNAKLKQLFLYVVGVRDLGVVESLFKDLKVLPIGNISETENNAKTIALVVCYGRIFNKSEGIGRLKTKDFLRRLSQEEKKLHKWFCDARNEDYAHVDPRRTEIYVNFIPGNGKHRVISPLSYHSFSIGNNARKTVTSLLKKLRSYLEKKRDELAAELFRGKKNMQLIVYKNGFLEREVTDKG